ncbi:MAG: hypothetical protein AABX77_02635 [Nanoarchaeota archaeon]
MKTDYQILEINELRSIDYNQLFDGPRGYQFLKNSNYLGIKIHRVKK